MGLLIIYLYISNNKNNKLIIPNKEQLVKDSIIRDSIYIINDSIIETIKYIDKEYNEKVSIIMSSSDSANYVFYLEYIDNYNNKRIVKDN